MMYVRRRDPFGDVWSGETERGVFHSQLKARHGTRTTAVISRLLYDCATALDRAALKTPHRSNLPGAAMFDLIDQRHSDLNRNNSRVCAPFPTHTHRKRRSPHSRKTGTLHSPTYLLLALSRHTHLASPLTHALSVCPLPFKEEKSTRPGRPGCAHSRWEESTERASTKLQAIHSATSVGARSQARSCVLSPARGRERARSGSRYAVQQKCMSRNMNERGCSVSAGAGGSKDEVEGEGGLNPSRAAGADIRTVCCIRLSALSSRRRAVR